MPRFYVNLPLQISQEILLPSEVTRHLQVLRINPPAEIILFNGNGYSYLSTLITLNKRLAKAIIHSKKLVNLMPKLKITLGLCLINNDKMDLAIQKATELGVQAILPILSSHSQRLSLDKIAKKLEHWQKIIISSSEQCGANSLALIKPPLPFNQVITTLHDFDLKVILSLCKQKTNLTNHTPQSILLLVGPEGGLTWEEINLALTHNYQPLHLGPLIMRSETAAIVGVSTMHALFGTFLI